MWEIDESLRISSKGLLVKSKTAEVSNVLAKIVATKKHIKISICFLENLGIESRTKGNKIRGNFIFTLCKPHFISVVHISPTRYNRKILMKKSADLLLNRVLNFSLKFRVKTHKASNENSETLIPK